MRNRIVAAIVAAGLSGAGILYAQPAPEPEKDIADVSLPADNRAQLSPREMDNAADEILKEMEAFHKATLEDQAQARKAKDVIKLNCVNESLLAVKQLLNIAESAENDLDEALANGNNAEQVHQYGQIVIAHEKAETARGDSRNCIGEELHFIGKNDVTVDGPAIPEDPTDDGDIGEANGEDPFASDVDLEDPAYASPFAPI